MVKKTTLSEIAQMLTHVVEHMATKDDIENIDAKVNRIDHKVDGIQIQVNSIEQQLRANKAELRLGDLEEKVFGNTRG